jgi:hypothetical protein
MAMRAWVNGVRRWRWERCGFDEEKLAHVTFKHAQAREYGAADV